MKKLFVAALIASSVAVALPAQAESFRFNKKLPTSRPAPTAPASPDLVEPVENHIRAPLPSNRHHKNKSRHSYKYKRAEV
ncbi:MAG: hypothetical protein HRU20_27905 [Pseudomonadales bacterium]|nr:hypothetical protein [Pseudomonadales bacterium]